MALAITYESQPAMRLPMQWSLAAYGALLGVRCTSRGVLLQHCRCCSCRGGRSVRDASRSSKYLWPLKKSYSDRLLISMILRLRTKRSALSNA